MSEMQSPFHILCVLSKLYLCASIFGEGDLRLTQGGQHDTQLSAHDCAVALLVKDTQTLNVVIVGTLLESVNLLQHGQESVEVEPLVGHVCKFKNVTEGAIISDCVDGNGNLKIKCLPLSTEESGVFRLLPFSVLASKKGQFDQLMTISLGLRLK